MSSSNATATLTNLLSKTTLIDHHEALAAATAVLSSKPQDPIAQRTRIVALLKLDRFNDALRALDQGGDKLAAECVLERAYALYKTGQTSEANLPVGRDAHEVRGLKHVAAQVAYRGERFLKAQDVYAELAQETPGIEGEESDLRINTSAVDAQLEWAGLGQRVEAHRKKPGRADLEAFETSYNAACGCIARGDFTAASILLRRARDLCEALDELGDEEKRAEVLPIMVQQAYCWVKEGKLAEAQALWEDIKIDE